MKDYYNNKFDFIENYRIIKGGEIHLFYSDGYIWIVPHTKENEEIIKYKMLNQAKKINNNQNLYKKDKAKYFVLSNLAILGVGLFNIYLNQKFSFDLVKFVCINVPLMGIYLPFINKYFKNKTQLNEAKKISIFLEHEKEINERAKTNPNILGLSAKKVKKDEITINNYDRLTLAQLRDIRNNLVRDRHLDVEYRVKKKSKFR